ncbi:hypothetical protein TcWFU_010453 [Taenia crassiceps]|uniref:Uncharacterized protein n=1 Tax=Taenia crassiceps TaxID=6207 RepID=A0ABR4QUC1_9CEST
MLLSRLRLTRDRKDGVDNSRRRSEVMANCKEHGFCILQGLFAYSCCICGLVTSNMRKHLKIWDGWCVGDGSTTADAKEQWGGGATERRKRRVAR